MIISLTASLLEVLATEGCLTQKHPYCLLRENILSVAFNRKSQWPTSCADETAAAREMARNARLREGAALARFDTAFYGIGPGSCLPAYRWYRPLNAIPFIDGSMTLRLLCASRRQKCGWLTGAGRARRRVACWWRSSCVKRGGWALSVL